MTIDTHPYLIPPGQPVSLAQIPTAQNGGLSKDAARDITSGLIKRLQDHQERLHAEHKQSLLVVFQAMDATGKDSTIRHVIGPLNPAGVRVTSFKVPSQEEADHDFLWRIHRRAPARGTISVFNRSHYEEVLAVRVKSLQPEHIWQARYDHINAFEKLLADNGTRIVKFYLHASKAYQKERLQRRLDRPDKHWKFNPSDLTDRALWEDYRAAYEDALSRCSTPYAPWYVVPAEVRWYRDLIVAAVLEETLASMDIRLPEPTFDPTTITIVD